MRIPNCVPNYYLDEQENYNHECELYWNRQEWYKTNAEYRRQKYIDGCNEIRFYPTECEKCQYGEEAKPDSESDDMPTIICSNWKTCPVFIKDVRGSFPNVSFEEYCQWREEYVEKLRKGE